MVTEQEAKARAIAESFLIRGLDGGIVTCAQLLDGKGKERAERLKYFAKRFGKAMQARAIDINSKLSRKDCEFMFLEIFSRLDVSKPTEMIAAFKVLAAWLGLSQIPVRMLKLSLRHTPMGGMAKVGRVREDRQEAIVTISS